MENMEIIVSRHPAAVAFIREAAGLADDVPVFDGNVEYWQVKDKIVYGNLPLQLAKEARKIVAVEFAGAPPRGAEYTVDDMKAAGAKLAAYKVAVAPVDENREYYFDE